MKRTGKIRHDPLNAKQFEVVVRRLADALTFGQESSPFLGAGIEYVQSRLYQDGDPVKLMDWRVTGRTGKYHVKEYEAPRQMPVYLLVDTSASMCISSQEVSKYAWAVRIAGGIALAAVDHMNPVGMMTVGEREMHHLPTLARNQLMQWMHELRHHEYMEGTGLAEKIRKLIPQLENRSLLIVLSDLHDPDAVNAIKLMAQNHDCMVLHLKDPAEEGVVGAGIFRAREAETQIEFSAYGKSAWSGEDMGRVLKRSGVDYLSIKTNESVLPKLRNFMKTRGGSRR